MAHHSTRSFQELFKDKKYLRIKNYLYNYLLRKRSVNKCLKGEQSDLLLEVGSGISPLTADRSRVVYSDISFEAIRFLKSDLNGRFFVVADGARLPFKANIYSRVICSEVLEHLPDDRRAMSEIFRVLKGPHGRLILTVPHRKRYYGYDDRYVGHYRRYEVPEIRDRLRGSGFEPIRIKKILGPLEKITMLGVIYLFSMVNRSKSKPPNVRPNLRPQIMDLLVAAFRWFNEFYKGFVWLDAKIMPRSLATVILIESGVSQIENKAQGPAPQIAGQIDADRRRRPGAAAKERSGCLNEDPKPG